VSDGILPEHVRGLPVGSRALFLVAFGGDGDLTELRPIEPPRNQGRDANWTEGVDSFTH
jgi:hypothetical protein